MLREMNATSESMDSMMNVLTLVSVNHLLYRSLAVQPKPLITVRCTLSPLHKDPIHAVHSEASNKKAALEMPDFSKIGDEIFGALKKSPIGKLFAKN